MKLGDIILTDKVTHKGFGRQSASFNLKANPGNLMVFLSIGSVTLDSLPHFNPDGALAALGFGPVTTTLLQRRLVDALGAAKGFLNNPLVSRHEVQLKVDEVLTAAEAFRTAAAPVTDPIMADVLRFDFMRRVSEDENSPEALAFDQAQREAGRNADLRILVDEARRRMGAA